MSKSSSSNESESIDSEIFSQQCRIREQASTEHNVHRSSNSLSGGSKAGNTVPNINNKLNIPVNMSDDDSIQNRQPNTEGANDSGHAELIDIEEKRGTILAYGRELFDLIIVGYTSLSELRSQDESWEAARKHLIAHFEKLENNLKECEQRTVRNEEIIRMANACAAAAQAVPNPYVSLSARLIQLFTTLFSSIFRTNPDPSTEESDNILTALYKDVQASANLYSSGLQCHQQFEEITKLVEKFHAEARELRYNDVENGDMTAFIGGMLEYKPNHRTFYLKLQDCLRELSKNISGDFGRRFYEPFSYNPSAVEVVRYLNWRFRYQEFNPESVRFAMEQLRDQIQGNSITVTNLLANVKGLLHLLRDELEFIESCFKDVKSFNNQ